MNYATQIGAAGRGSSAINNREISIAHVSDILRRAAVEKLDVWMTTDSLDQRVNLLYKTDNNSDGLSLAGLLRNVVETGAQARVLIWNEGHGLVAPAFRQLAYESHGRFEVAISNDKKNWESVLPFVVAMKDGDPEQRCYLYMERPHPPIDPFKDRIDLNVSAMACMDTEISRQDGPLLISAFKKLWEKGGGLIDNRVVDPPF